MSNLEEEYYLIHQNLDAEVVLKKFRKVISQLKNLGAIPQDQGLARELKAEKKALEKLLREKGYSEKILEIVDKKQYQKTKFQAKLALGAAKIIAGLGLIILSVGIALDTVFLVYGLGFTGIALVIYGGIDIYAAYQLYRN